MRPYIRATRFATVHLHIPARRAAEAGLSTKAEPLSMTDKVPKLLFDALGAIAASQEFVAGCSMGQYMGNKMRRSAVDRHFGVELTCRLET
ncbi:MAG: hypothetical protein IPG23_03140 [Burkholderiales bacterium]|nr:hypothetical protein [Burkholderiales bacterium]